MRETWWRGAAIYQVYLRSFADGNGDGLGDLAGLRNRLAYLSDLGIDAIWLQARLYTSGCGCSGNSVGGRRTSSPEDFIAPVTIQ